ncbi:pullulanase-type alpha-1,6-glucosidase [Photobacterium aphoticum]|uniref:Type II secretion protein n=1 Tax=Photobacterium aphoticum TaxID=754436 RepID=A0A0J1JJY1_9GAMM|nr:pullulanase-type alpha-1,6-glucosidase [Photobacterium aphoticum]KLV02307.1 type II secretion protein [Photobacterium aphoticum]PSU56287.1 pullulanase-type alpha-1,6-glucosidase [Photobacterium aphoticum]GHA55460.1 pullulanase [Photobacterium aphoticum]
MKFTLSAVAKAVLPLCSAAVLVGCNSNSSHNDADGYFDTTNPPAIDIALPKTDGPQATLPKAGAVPEPITAGDNEAVIYFVDKSNNKAFDQYSLHVWNNDTCDRAEEVNGEWGNKTILPDGVDAQGPYWRLPLVDGKTACINFIVRDENLSNLTGDAKLAFNEISDRTASYLSGSTAAYDERGDAYVQLFGIANAEAHLASSHILLWEGVEHAEELRLYVSLDGQLQPNEKGTYDADYAVLTPVPMPASVRATQPHLIGKTAYMIDGNIDMRPIMKAQMAVLAVDNTGTVIKGTKVQPAVAFDQLFASAAKDVVLGAAIVDNNTQFNVWAPSAQNVVAVLFDDAKKELGRLQMDYDARSGVWSLLTDKAPSGTYYRYLVDVFHPVSGKVEHYQVTDPYSLSLSMNSAYSQVIDLNDPALKPDGWDDLKRPVPQDNPAQFVIYEAHVRDFSAHDASTPVADRGKFSAFTQADSVPVKHLKSLSDNGVTHLHLLPIFDIASINENPDEVANIDEPFSKLCQVNKDVAGSEFGQYCDSELLISEVFDRVAQDDTKENPAVQALNRYVSSSDSFNWGYDPFHYTVPEGSYATNAEGPQRIKELREAVMAMKQDIGMNVVMDVVYNHTNAAGPDARTSVLDKLVPWYYQRLNPTSGNVENSTCCSNTAPERAMFEKLISDSLVVWSRDYKIDAYRFDLMGHHPLAQIQRSLKAVQAVDPDTYFYGEGWNFGEVQDDALFIQATQKHLGGTGIGSFSDRLRDAVRGGSPFDGGDNLRKTQGFGNGALVMPNDISTVSKETALHQADLTRLGMAGNLKAFKMIDATGKTITGAEMNYSDQAAGYADDPTEIQNYVSKHDNQTLWDNNQYKIGYDVPMETRVRMQAVSLATAMLGQGVPFTHMGSELLRSKSMQRDSYDSGDRYNNVDFTLNDNNWDKGLPRKDKDGDNYALIEKVIADAAANVLPEPTDMATMVDYYEELARLRQSYPLITLGKGAEVIKRVDFHNTGSDQIPGLIVMSIDNGNTSGADIDAKLDGLVIVINATPETQTIASPAGATLARSAHHTSTLAKDATFTDGKMVVPAWTPVVFELPRQASGRAAGLPVTTK